MVVLTASVEWLRVVRIARITITNLQIMTWVVSHRSSSHMYTSLHIQTSPKLLQPQSLRQFAAIPHLKTRVHPTTLRTCLLLIGMPFAIFPYPSTGYLAKQLYSYLAVARRPLSCDMKAL